MKYSPITSTRFLGLSKVFYSQVSPTPLVNPRWVSWNTDLASDLNLPVCPDKEPHMLDVFSGQKEGFGFRPIAMKYTGHQFGLYNPDLGDGRGLLLGEIQTQNGDWLDVHLKGSGQTPYSRSGDGRAVLRSTIREYLCGEAMQGLGIATTRALGVITSDTPVIREQQEQAAILVRTAKTHIRFGHFEYCFYTEQFDAMRELADSVIDWYWPQCNQASKPYLAMFENIVERTASMIAQWQSVGFTHGVMNTDNMSILGETFDFGPFGFLDSYEPSFVSNHSDYEGRYAFERQPSIALWNLTALAHALTPLIEKADLELALSKYDSLVSKQYSALMRQKLGLQSKYEGDSELFEQMFNLLEVNQVDYTCFMRALSSLDRESGQSVIDLVQDQQAANNWLAKYLQRCQRETHQSGEWAGSPITVEQRCRAMRQVNPKFILRNYLAQQAIEQAEQGEYQMVEDLRLVLSKPFEEHARFTQFSRPPPEWGKRLRISCSS